MIFRCPHLPTFNESQTRFSLLRSGNLTEDPFKSFGHDLAVNYQVVLHRYMDEITRGWPVSTGLPWWRLAVLSRVVGVPQVPTSSNVA